MYGKAVGFFGGISWALLTAAVCQRLPQQASPDAILQNFFMLWSTWPWPHPAALGEAGEDTPLRLPPALSDKFPEWRPNFSPGFMPVVVPRCGLPTINSSHQLSMSTVRE